MKNYLLFCYDDYYPNGGMTDLYEDFDKLDDAVSIAKTMSYDNVEIYSLKGREVVWSHLGIGHSNSNHHPKEKHERNNN